MNDLIYIPATSAQIKDTCATLMLSIASCDHSVTDFTNPEQTAIIHNSAEMLARFSANLEVIKDEIAAGEGAAETEFLEVTPRELDTLVRILKIELDYDWTDDERADDPYIDALVLAQSELLETARYAFVNQHEFKQSWYDA